MRSPVEKRFRQFRLVHSRRRQMRFGKGRVFNTLVALPHFGQWDGIIVCP